MRLLLLAILLGFPLLELVLLARLAESHGWWVLAWVVLAAMAGFALLKEARFALVARLGAELAAGQFSIAAVIDSARTVLAGLLLIWSASRSILGGRTVRWSAVERGVKDSYPCRNQWLRWSWARDWGCGMGAAPRIVRSSPRSSRSADP